MRQRYVVLIVIAVVISGIAALRDDASSSLRPLITDQSTVVASPFTVTDFFATAQARGCFMPTATSPANVTPEPFPIAKGPVKYPLPTC